MKQECIDNKVLKLVADDVYVQIMEDKEIKEMFTEAEESDYGHMFVMDWMYETLKGVLKNMTRYLENEEYYEESDRICYKLAGYEEKIKHLNDINSFDWAEINYDGRGFAKVRMRIILSQTLLELLGPEYPPLTTECFRLRECRRIDGDLWTGIVDSNPIFIYEVEAEEHVTFTPSNKNGVELCLQGYSKEQLLEFCEAVVRKENS